MRDEDFPFTHQRGLGAQLTPLSEVTIVWVHVVIFTVHECFVQKCLGVYLQMITKQNYD